MIATLSNSLLSTLWWAKEKVWPTATWKMEAYLENYAVITVFEEAMDAYSTSIYHLGFDKALLRASRVRYRSLLQSEATKTHYVALKQVLDVELKHRCYSTLKWERMV